MNTAAAPNDPTAQLWQTLRDFIVQAFSLFGDPCAIAQRAYTLRKSHQLLLGYLRQCETLLRKLLFIEALALLPSLESGPAASSRQGRTRQRRTHEQDPESSETWRVCFRVSSPACGGSGSREARDVGGRHGIPPQSSLRADSSPVHGGAKRFTSTWPTAERFEALIRAFNDPAPYAKRLARILKRRAQLIRAYFLHVPERHYGKTILEQPIADATRLARQRFKDQDSS